MKNLATFFCGMAALIAGCDGISPKGGNVETCEKVPDPISLLLPQKISIHPFTQTATFEDGKQGLHMRIQFTDFFGDPTKAFGDLRFELYEFKPYQQHKRGDQLDIWDEYISDPDKNMIHWDSHTRSYEFRLASKNPILPGQKFILVVYFNSRFTPRMTAETVLTAE